MIYGMGYIHSLLNYSNCFCSVVLTILKKMSSSMGRIIPHIMEKMFETTNQVLFGQLFSQFLESVFTFTQVKSAHQSGPTWKTG